MSDAPMTDELWPSFGLFLEECDDDEALSLAEDLSFNATNGNVWPEMASWMERAGLRSLLVNVAFSSPGRGKAVWADNSDDQVVVNVFVSDADGAGLPASLVGLRYLDAALAGLAAHFDAGPAPKARRTAAEEVLEASAPPVVLGELPLLPERMEPASRDRLWEEIDAFVADPDGYLERWAWLEPEDMLRVRAAGIQETERWVAAAASVEGEDYARDREFQSVTLMSLGREVFEEALREPARFLDVWPEEVDPEIFLIALEIG